jgi:hypothetical protein
MPGRLLYNYIWRSLGFSPLELFASGESGVWYDPSDLTTLFQDSLGTTPVASDGDPVGLMLDKSQGLVLGSELISNGTFDTDTSGWTTTGAASLSVSSQTLKVTTSGGAAAGRYTVTGLVVGSYYQISVDIEEDTQGTGNPFISALGETQVITDPKTYSLIVQAANTTQNLDISLGAAALNGEFIRADNITVKELKGNHAVQTVSASRPTYRLSGGLHSLEFDGVDDYLDVGSAFNYEDVTACMGINAAVDGRVLDNRGTGSAGTPGWHALSNSGSGWVVVDDGTSSFANITGGVDADTDGIIYVQYEDATDTLSGAVDGAAFTTATEASGGSILTGVGGRIGAASNNASQQLDGKIYSIIVVDGIRDSSERSDMEEYTASKSGVTL